MTANPSQSFWPQNCGCYVTNYFGWTSTDINMKKKQLLTHVWILMNDNNASSETIWSNQNKCYTYTKSNMVPILDISLFSTDNFVKISMGRSCNHDVSALASLFVTKTNTKVRYGLIWCINANTMCSKIVNSLTAKMLWPISLGRRGRQLFVTTKWRYRTIIGIFMTNKHIYGIWKFLILNFSHFLGPTLQNGFGEAIY